MLCYCLCWPSCWYQSNQISLLFASGPAALRQLPSKALPWVLWLVFGHKQSFLCPLFDSQLLWDRDTWLCLFCGPNTWCSLVSSSPSDASPPARLFIQLVILKWSFPGRSRWAGPLPPQASVQGMARVPGRIAHFLCVFWGRLCKRVTFSNWRMDEGFAKN